MPRVFKYHIGDQVRVLQLDDDLAHRGLVGHVGVIVDRVGDAFPQPLSYEIKCITCGATHFMHETELLSAKQGAGSMQPKAPHSALPAPPAT